MNYKDFAIKLAKDASVVIKANFKLDMKKDWKSDKTPVTVTDKRVNDLVIARVKKQFPTHGVLGEEKSYLPQKSDMVWVCDPIDGTIPFSHGIPTFVFSLALVKDGRPILGVIAAPLENRIYVAETGKGAYLNGKRIHVSKDGFDNAVGFWEVKSMTEICKTYKNVFWLNIYSICYEGITVAHGGAIATFYDYGYAHDVAALKVIVEEAGGKVTDKDGHEQRYDGPVNGALITNGKVHKQLLEFIKFHHK